LILAGTRKQKFELTLAQARAVTLAAQGLLDLPIRPATKNSVLAQIRRMGALQIDTISVVARSPYLVLWSRLGAFDTAWLDQHLAERRIFEYWAHAACFLPIEDFPLFRRQMIEPKSFSWQYSVEWVKENQSEVDRVLSAIRESGPMRSADFGSDSPRVPGWWEWKPAKRALEMLFTSGELMIARREHFHRVYDLRERILPDHNDATVPAAHETVTALTEKAVRSLGIARAEWVADYYRLPKKVLPGVLAELADRGVILPVAVNGWDVSGYVHRDHRGLVSRALAGKLEPTLTTILSPFDPIVWDRARASALFDFDYRLECYTPEPKRQYGYFTLPILYRGALVGRIDAKAHRRTGVFEVKVIHLEPGIPPSPELVEDLGPVLQKFADWHQTPQIEIIRTEPRKLKSLLAATIRRNK
jgi:uncharacterized protein YcaQ